MTPIEQSKAPRMTPGLGWPPQDEVHRDAIPSSPHVQEIHHDDSSRFSDESHGGFQKIPPGAAPSISSHF
jgi:hypothetical protein